MVHTDAGNRVWEVTARMHDAPTDRLAGVLLALSEGDRYTRAIRVLHPIGRSVCRNSNRL
ncbi:MAG: hypothetical protein WB460_21605 [Candidatus Acidiferrales bacterium]